MKRLGARNQRYSSIIKCYDLLLDLFVLKVQRLYDDLRKVKSQTCPHNIGPQSFCEAIPFFGCYCFSIDKKVVPHFSTSYDLSQLFDFASICSAIITKQRHYAKKTG